MKWKSYILLAIILPLFNGCNKSECESCPEDIICTKQFVSINVDILDCENVKLIPVRMETILEKTGEIIFTTSNANSSTILTDAQMNKIRREGSSLVFKAYMVNNKGIEFKIVEETYVIGHDCCHVIKISGKDQIKTNSESCNLVPEVGPCNAAIKKYFYDPVDKKCKEFIWGGCAGVVPFDNLIQCETACSCK